MKRELPKLRRLAALCLWPLLTTQAHAATHVRVVETFPAGNPVALHGNENFYLRLHYETDTPVSIWVKPCFHGSPVSASTNASPTYTGSGDALGWFSLNTAGAAVDEVRIMVGDGSIKGTSVALSHPLDVVAGAGGARQDAQPAWVADLIAADGQRWRDTREHSSSGGGGIFLSGFMLVVLALLIASVALPIRALRRWRGRWRLYAAVPLAVMVFVVLRIVAGVSRDPTSHNLWPFEILQAGFLSVVAMVALTLWRKWTGGDEA